MTNPVSTSATPVVTVVRPEGGNTLHAFGDAACVKLGGEQTGGTMSVVLDTTPPGSGPPPHRHALEDEVFLTVDEGFRYLANGEWTEPLPANSVVYAPRGTVHTFQNTNGQPARHWIILTPSGFENFFARCAPLFAVQGAPPDMASIVTISTECGIEYVPPLASAPPAVHV